jgi:hypothetical protein
LTGPIQALVVCPVDVPERDPNREPVRIAASSSEARALLSELRHPSESKREHKNSEWVREAERSGAMPACNAMGYPPLLVYAVNADDVIRVLVPSTYLCGYDLDVALAAASAARVR